MIKSVGYYRGHDDKIILVVPLDKKDFDRFKEHIENNMFFAYRRVAPEYKSILLVSIGDHLDKNDRQDIIKADICVETITKKDLSKDMIKCLEDNASWFVFLSCIDESYIFSIDKDTQFIKSRVYYKE